MGEHRDFDCTQFVEQFKVELKTRGHRLTNQRVAIAESFAVQGGHLTVDQLYRSVSDAHPEIGYATVYRTLRLLVDCGLAETHQFDLNKVSFEIHDPEDHHDHLICVGCRAIIEFENHHIEALQEQIAREYKFTLTSHRMELYGLCQDCKEKQS
jgi:Fur family ferric uptake transcriptional regulator